MRSVGFLCLRSPLITNRRAIRLQNKRAGNARGRSIESLEFGGAMRGPAAPGGRYIEVLVSYGLPVELNGEFTFVLRKDRWRGESDLLLSRRDGAATNQDCRGGDD